MLVPDASANGGVYSEAQQYSGIAVQRERGATHVGIFQVNITNYKSNANGGATHIDSLLQIGIHNYKLKLLYQFPDNFTCYNQPDN